MTRATPRLFLFTIAAMAFCLGGCAEHRSERTDIQRPTSFPGAYQSISITTGPMVGQVEDEFLTFARRELRSRQVFDMVTIDNPSADLWLMITERDGNAVSSGHRFWFGSFAGASWIQVHCQVLVSESREVIGEFIAHGQRRSTGMVGGTTGASAEELARIISDYFVDDGPVYPPVRPMEKKTTRER